MVGDIVLTVCHFLDPLDQVDDLREDWWLEVLIKKYRSEYLTPEENAKIVSDMSAKESLIKDGMTGSVDAVESRGHPYLPPLARFATFLSFCLLEEIDCTPIEMDALYKVVTKIFFFHDPIVVTYFPRFSFTLHPQ